MIEDRINAKEYEYLVDFFRDMIYPSLQRTMSGRPTAHYDSEEIEWIANCEFDEYMNGLYYGLYDGDVLRTDYDDFAINENTEDAIIDAFNEARNIEIENFYDDNKEYIW